MKTAGQHHISLSHGRGNIRTLAVLNELHMAYGGTREGQVAAYIPELAKVAPDLFAIAVVTVDGEVFSVGDVDARFTIQSIANPFVYGMVIDALGRDAVREVVGVEPSGNPFNAIVLDPRTNRPMNPMVNAGAIAVASLAPGTDPTDRLNRVLAMFATYLGAAPAIDMEVFMSERSTGDRNRSIAYLMKNFGVLRSSVEHALDLYFQCCAVHLNCVELATMAATLANRGRNPLTGAQAVSSTSLRDVLSIMYTCGLYESSGSWVHSVGIPAKSGVGGGLLAVAPGKMGIGIFSPRLDRSGNSVRGMHVCRDLAAMLDLHLFEAGSWSREPGITARSS